MWRRGLKKGMDIIQIPVTNNVFLQQQQQQQKHTHTHTHKHTHTNTSIQKSRNMLVI
jgi:hypothetical protein